jgi:hypothetical protein
MMDELLNNEYDENPSAYALARVIHTDIYKLAAYTQTDGIPKKKHFFLLRSLEAYKSVKILASIFSPP